MNFFASAAPLCRRAVELPFDALRGVYGAAGQLAVVAAAVAAAAGVWMVAYAGYEQATDTIYASHQDALEAELDQLLAADAPADTPDPAAPEPTEPGTRPPTQPERQTTASGALGRLEIPAIGLTEVIVEGTGTYPGDRQGPTLADLRKGSAHYQGTPLPGEAGNAALAGHRTTFGAPFRRLDELGVGDRIIVTTADGTFTYQLDRAPYAVDATDWDVIADTPGQARLTLTTCHPPGAKQQRLVVSAALVDADRR